MINEARSQQDVKSMGASILCYHIQDSPRLSYSGRDNGVCVCGWGGRRGNLG